MPKTDRSHDTFDDLIPYGWSDTVAAGLAPHLSGDRLPGRVLRAERGSSLVVVPRAGPVRCAPPPGFSGLVTGDWVTVEPTPAGRTVAAVLERTTAIRREAPSGGEQVLAANVDTVFVLHGLDRPLKLRRLERTLVAAWDSGATPVVVLTKTDLIPGGPDGSEVTAAIVAGAAPGVPVLPVSNATGTGLDAVARIATPGRTIALVGESGVGKSSLVNRLAGRAVLATGATRSGDGKGRHTTTARELVALPTGACLIDTPGLRALALWEGEAGLSAAFADVEERAGQCRYRDCAHRTEPGCAVSAAVDAGELAPARVASYRKLDREIRMQARRAEDRRRRLDKRSTRRRSLRAEPRVDEWD